MPSTPEHPTPAPIPGNGPHIAGSPWLLDDERPEQAQVSDFRQVQDDHA